MYDWKQNLWKDVRNIGFMILGIAGFYGMSLLPEDSTVKQIFAIVFMVVFGLLILMFTPLGNLIKRLIRKYQTKK